jgi:hypothetical protein
MDTWTVRMRRRARGRIATALQLRVTTTTATSPRCQRGAQLAEAAREHGRWRVGLGRVRAERKEWAG